MHGAGRVGRDAWPLMSQDDALFAELSHDLPFNERARRLARLTPSCAVMIAHSAGAVTAALAIDRFAVTPEALVLVEPALFDIARGSIAVERHVGAVTDARRYASEGDLFGFWQRFRPMFFGGPADAEAWADEQHIAARFAAMELPWGHGIDAESVGHVPTLVVTGAWNDEYEEIASELTRHGARHVQLTGFQHRPQDSPDFADMVDDFVRSRPAPLRPADAPRYQR